MEKSDLRKLHLKTRQDLSESERIKKSEAITEKLVSLPCYGKAQNIMVYLSAKGEVLTEGFIKKAISDGKKLSAPVCRENFLMDACLFSDFSDLAAGKYGILTPKGEEKIPREELDLVIVPGSVFGKNKHRVGYGKGYYDRFISGISPKCVTVGISFGINLIEKVPFGEFDMPLDIIITENEIIM